MAPNRWELKPETLRAVSDPDQLGFETTLDLTPLKEKVVAQDRAVHALEFGLGVRDLEYNIFVAGPPRAGKTETIMAYVAELAAKEPSPPDYIYVHNFKDPDTPRAIMFPAGSGRKLQKDINDLVAHLRRSHRGFELVARTGAGQQMAILDPGAGPHAYSVARVFRRDELERLVPERFEQVSRDRHADAPSRDSVRERERLGGGEREIAARRVLRVHAEHPEDERPGAFAHLPCAGRVQRRYAVLPCLLRRECP